MSTPAPSHSDVLVVGGGIGGLHAAKIASHHGCTVTVVDTRGVQTFQPLLYQVATGTLPVDVVDYPLAEARGLTVVTSAAESVDLEARSVTLADGSVHTGDYLVLATGAQVNFFGVPGAADHAIPLYTSDDALRLRARVQQLVEEGSEFTVAVVGAGATGVEFAGALGDVIDGALPRTYPKFGDVKVTLHLIDRGTVPVAPMRPESQQAVTAGLEKSGVVTHFGRSVTQVRPDGVDLDDGTTIECGLVVWSGGIAVGTPTLVPDPARRHGGRVQVQTDLRLPGLDRVYCVGDAAADSTAPLPQLGSVAKQQGMHVGHSIRRQRAGKEPMPFHYLDLGDMVMIQYNDAAVELGPRHLEITGEPAFVMWLGLHGALLPDNDQRWAAVHSWFHEMRTGTAAFLGDGAAGLS